MPSHVYLLEVLWTVPFWLAVWFFRPALRRKLLFSSIALLPFAVMQTFFVPAFWDPNVFGAINLTDKIFLEDFLHLFFVGGLAGTAYQAATNSGPFNVRKVPWWTVTAAMAVFLLYLIFPLLTIDHWLLAGLALSTALYLLADAALARPVLLNGALLLFTQLPFFLIFWYTLPDWRASYNYANLLGIFPGGIPIEELAYFFLGGTWWSFGYELLFRRIKF